MTTVMCISKTFERQNVCYIDRIFQNTREIFAVVEHFGKT